MNLKKYILSCFVLFLCIENSSAFDSSNRNDHFIKKIETLESDIKCLKSDLKFQEMKIDNLKTENLELKKEINNNPFTMAIQHYKEIIRGLNDEINDLTPGFICWVKNIFSNQDENKKIAFAKIDKYKIYKEIYKKEAICFVDNSATSFIKSLENSVEKIKSLKLEKLIDIANLKEKLIFPNESDIVLLSRNVEIEKLRILNYFSNL